MQCQTCGDATSPAYNECQRCNTPLGLPVAVQFVGPPGSELLLLGVAGQFEMQAPWQRHAPGYPRVGTGSPARA